MGRASRRKRERSSAPSWSAIEAGEGHGFCDSGLVHHLEEIGGWRFWFCGHGDETKLTIGAPPSATLKDLQEASEMPELGVVVRGVGAEARRRSLMRNPPPPTAPPG